MITTATQVFTKRPAPNDICDSNCPAKAVVRVTLEGGSLVFCGHHYDTRSPILDEITVGVCDTRLTTR